MAEINRQDIIADDAIKAPLDLAHNLDQAIVSLEKIRRAAIQGNTALQSSQSSAEVRKLVSELQGEHNRLQQINKDLVEQIRLQNTRDRTSQNAERSTKKFHKGIIDMLKDIRIGGISVGQVLDKMEKANERVFSNMSGGFNKAAISARFFGTAARTALTLTGIGALLIALSLIVTHWDDITDAIGITDNASRKHFEQFKKDLDESNEKLTKQLELLKAQGAEEELLKTISLFEKRKQLREAEIALTKEQGREQRSITLGTLGGQTITIKGVKKQSDAEKELTKITKDLSNEVNVLEGELTQLDLAQAVAGTKAREASKKAANESEKEFLARLERERMLRIQHLTDQQTADRRSLAERDDAVEASMVKDLGRTQTAAEEKIAIEQRFTKRLNDELKQRNKDAEEAQKALDEANATAIARRQQEQSDALMVTADAFNIVADASAQATNRRLENLQLEEDELTKHYDRLIAMAGDNVARRTELENELANKQEEIEKRRRSELRRSAMAQKADALFSIVLNTAKAIMAAASNPLTAAWVIPAIAALGAAQLGIAAAQPIPAYEKGTAHHKGGLAKVGEKGEELIYNPSTGEASLSPSKPTIMDLPKGAMVMPHDKTMQVLATAGLERQHSHTVIENNNTVLAAHLREINNSIKNKREMHLNLTRKGIEMMFKHAETRNYFLGGMYR
jgi:hypothetical protein